MPGTTRYSATFDRTYDEDESSTAEPPVVARRSRSQSLQVDSLSDRKHLYSLAGSQDSHSRSSSTEKPPKGAEVIPTRTVGKPTVKPHNNPFQFVKIGTCPLYKKAEEQLQKVKEIKKPAVIKEDEEEWQSNLDSWKSRRRKMSEGTFRRQEELRRLEYEELLRSSQPQQQKKIKTFTEIVEERANRGRALSLCLFTNPLESGEWVFENTRSRRTSHDPLQVSEESAESSNINSEDDNDSFRKPEEGLNGSVVNDKMRGDDDQPEHHRNGVQTSTSNSSISKNSDLSEFDVSQESISHKDQSPGSICTDSGLESLSSSQRVGDIADSGSDFSQDSGSSIGCDSPRVSGLISSGVDLEEFSSNDELVKSTMISQKEKSPEKVTNGVHVSRTSASEVKDHPAKSTTDAKKTSKEKTKKVKKTAAKKTSTETAPVTKVEPKSKASFSPNEGEKNTESENEVSVDDFDRLAKLKTEESLRKTRAAEHSQLSSSVSSAQVSEVHANPSNHKTSKTSESNSVNVVYSSCPKNVSEKKSEPQNKGDSSLSQPQTNGNSNNFSLIGEVPVDKVTEEMERLILQQLEEEERAKEMEANAKSLITEVELPSKRVNPPQEKPPPPPITAAAAATTTTPVKKTSPKDTSVKRTNSTKRILKEIHKRRSDFLGIEETKGAADTSDDKAVHCPPTCADSVRTEQEGKSATSAAPEEEDEIARKEREIIENLETEERLKKNQSGSTLAQSLPLSTAASLDVEEEERIKRLKEELKRNEEERLLAEEQRMRLEEEKLLKLREQQIREQEAKDVQSQATTTTTAAASANETLSSNDNKVCEPVANEEKVSLLADGDGSIALTSSSASSAPSSAPLTAELSKPEEAAKPPPALAPRPLKKKEAIRRERERLRHEQEALQREREEHRRKVQMEQEQLKRSLQKAHVPGTPVCQVDTLSATTTTTTTATKPSLPPQLTPSLHKAHVHREASGQAVPPRTQNGLSEGAAVSGPFSPPKSKGSVQPKQIAGSSSRPRNAASETRTKPKVPLRKQAEPSGDSRYNQNHWLIQEAEMRRIAEQKERQHNQFHSDTRQNNPSFHSPVYADGYPNSAKPVQRPSALPLAQNSTNYAVPMQYSPDKSWNCAPPAHHNVQSRKCVPQGHINFDASQSPVVYSSNFDLSKSAPAKPSRSVPLEKQEHMLSVSGRKRCSHCGEELGRGAAMIIESLQLYYHIQCFQCCVCHAQLGNGSCGTDVRVRNNKLHCHNCYSNDEAGLKFSQV